MAAQSTMRNTLRHVTCCHHHTTTTFTSRGHGELREPPLREAHHTLSTSLAPLLSRSLSRERDSEGAREPLLLDEASSRARRKKEKIILSFVLAEILLIPLLKLASVLKKQAGRKNRILRPDFDDFLARTLRGRCLGTL